MLLLVSKDANGDCVPCEDFERGCPVACNGVADLPNTFALEVVYFTDQCDTAPGTPPSDPTTVTGVLTRVAPELCEWAGTSTASTLVDCPDPLTDLPANHIRYIATLKTGADGWEIEIQMQVLNTSVTPPAWANLGGECLCVRNVANGVGPVGVYEPDPVDCGIADRLSRVEIT